LVVVYITHSVWTLFSLVSFLCFIFSMILVYCRTGIKSNQDQRMAQVFSTFNAVPASLNCNRWNICVLLSGLVSHADSFPRARELSLAFQGTLTKFARRGSPSGPSTKSVSTPPETLRSASTSTHHHCLHSPQQAQHPISISPSPQEKKPAYRAPWP